MDLNFDEITNTLTDDIQNRILNKLQGYITDGDVTCETTDLDFDNIVTDTELELFYSQALIQSISYCHLQTYPTIILNDEDEGVMDEGFLESVILWCAGLIWRKYDVRPLNTQLESDGYSISYGDQLIIDAKNGLKPYQYRCFGVW